MRRRVRSVCGKIFLIWLICGTLLTGWELVRQQIPENLHLYEEDVVSVLSGAEKKIAPEALALDFAGEIEIARAVDGGYEATCQLFGLIPIKTMEVELVSRQMVHPGGIPVGIYVETDGIFVIGTGPVETEQGSVESPAKNILKTGDYITRFQGNKISEKQELVDQLKSFGGEEVILGIRRNEGEVDVCIEPILIKDGAHLGIWVRDDTQGVGTLTFVTEDGRFGALGHGISDEDSQILMEISKGKLYDCEIMEITKGRAGEPGKIMGKIVYSQDNLYGKVTENVSGGIYGIANESLKNKVKDTAIPIALKQEIHEGPAVIRCSVSGNVEEYAVEIAKIHRGESNVNKGMELVVTDERLLQLTGGIIQGMSGSPILQDGKLVGAVTHVLVNDSAKGYGIFIENMLEESE